MLLKRNIFDVVVDKTYRVHLVWCNKITYTPRLMNHRKLSTKTDKLRLRMGWVVEYLRLHNPLRCGGWLKGFLFCPGNIGSVTNTTLACCENVASTPSPAWGKSRYGWIFEGPDLLFPRTYCKVGFPNCLPMKRF